MLVGLPVEHYLGRFERLALRGALLAAVGAVAVVGLRRLPAERRHPLAGLPLAARRTIAVALDGSVVAAIVAGLLAVARRAAHRSGNGWIDVTLMVALLAVYIVATRRAGGTVGETLTGARYGGYRGRTQPVSSRG
jgi:hypothetical protein